MECGRTLLSAPPLFPSRAHLKNPFFSSARHFPTSVILQEQRDEFRPLPSMFKENTTYQVMLDKKEMDIGTLVREWKKSDDLEPSLCDFERQSLNWSVFGNLVQSSQTGQNAFLSLTVQSVTTNSETLTDVDPTNVIDLAKKALSAAKLAASLAENSVDLDNSVSSGLGSSSSSHFSLEDVEIVRSSRHLERQSKNRRVQKAKEMFHEPLNSRRTNVQRKTHKQLGPTNHLQVFTSRPETRRVFTAEEESALIVQIQNLLRLEAVKSRLQSQFVREPTLDEWARAVGLSCRALQLQLYHGHISREKLIYANLRLVVHIAKRYQGRGLSFEDLLQEGTMGLMKSFGKYNPKAACRFSSCAYWWIRENIRVALFKHSRIIRIPEHFYALLNKVTQAKKWYVQEGNHHPTNKEIAKRVGITVEKLEKFLFMTRMPVSLQQAVRTDQDTTVKLQDIIADSRTENLDVIVEKQMMRQHFHRLLEDILSERERLIIKLRYGIGTDIAKSQREVTKICGLSGTRVRKVEKQAMAKLKRRIPSHELDSYRCLLF